MPCTIQYQFIKNHSRPFEIWCKTWCDCYNVFIRYSPWDPWFHHLRKNVQMKSENQRMYRVVRAYCLIFNLCWLKLDLVGFRNIRVSLPASKVSMTSTVRVDAMPSSLCRWVPRRSKNVETVVHIYLSSNADSNLVKEVQAELYIFSNPKGDRML